jgi:hypothetical protein
MTPSARVHRARGRLLIRPKLPEDADSSPSNRWKSASRRDTSRQELLPLIATWRAASGRGRGKRGVF